MTAALLVITYMLGIFVTVWLFDWLEYITDGIKPLTPTFGECLLKLIVGLFWPLMGFWWLQDCFSQIKEWRREYFEKRNN